LLGWSWGEVHGGAVAFAGGLNLDRHLFLLSTATSGTSLGPGILFRVANAWAEKIELKIILHLERARGIFINQKQAKYISRG
jgi:hypothetical protein